MGTKLYITDPDTGEIIDEMADGDRIIRKKSLEAWEEIRRRKEKMLERTDLMDMRYKEFNRMNTDELKALNKARKLTPDENALLFAVTPFMGNRSCAVLNRDGEEATLDDISDICGFGKNKTGIVLKGMVKKRLLARTVSGRSVIYFMNPWICTRGTLINATLLKMFGKYPVLSRGGKTWEELVNGK